MTADDRFNNFYKAIRESNPIWFDGLGLVFPGKDIKEGIKKTWITLHAEGKLKSSIDWKEARNLVNKTLTWQDVKSSDGFEKAVPVEIHPQALTGEAREARIKEFLQVLAKVGNPQTERTDPYKAVREQWKAPEGAVYHPDPEAGRLADLRREYGRLHTEKSTGKQLPGSPTFEEFIRDL